VTITMTMYLLINLFYHSLTVVTWCKMSEDTSVVCVHRYKYKRKNILLIALLMTICVSCPDMDKAMEVYT
jgi:hypothetical protein